MSVRHVAARKSCKIAQSCQSCPVLLAGKVSAPACRLPRAAGVRHLDGGLCIARQWLAATWWLVFRKLVPLGDADCRRPRPAGPLMRCLSCNCGYPPVLRHDLKLHQSTHPRRSAARQHRSMRTAVVCEEIGATITSSWNAACPAGCCCGYRACRYVAFGQRSAPAWHIVAKSALMSFEIPRLLIVSSLLHQTRFRRAVSRAYLWVHIFEMVLNSRILSAGCS